MKIFLMTVLAGLLLTGKFTTYTKEAITKEYGKIFTAKVATAGNKKVAQKNIKKLPASHFLADFVNNNPRMIDYLVDNYAQVDNSQLDSLVNDPAALDKFYVQSLQKDSVFNEHFIEMLGHFLTSKNHQIKEETFVKDTITVDTLMSIASKFFHADTVRADGNIGWKIATGIENMDELQEADNPIAEAFVYTTIATGYPKTPAIKDDFMKAASQAQGDNKVVPGNIDEATLLAVRKGVNNYMSQSEALKQLLLTNYEEKKSVLNFVLQQ